MLLQILWAAALAGSALILIGTLFDTDVLDADLSGAPDPGTGWGILGLRGLIWGLAVGGWIGLGMQWSGLSVPVVLGTALLGAGATALGVNALLHRLGRDAGGEMPGDELLLDETVEVVVLPSANAPGVATLVVGGQVREFPVQAAQPLRLGAARITDVRDGVLWVTASA